MRFLISLDFNRRFLICPFCNDVSILSRVSYMVRRYLFWSWFQIFFLNFYQTFIFGPCFIFPKDVLLSRDFIFVNLLAIICLLYASWLSWLEFLLYAFWLASLKASYGSLVNGMFQFKLWSLTSCFRFETTLLFQMDIFIPHQTINLD